jgi:hypothetical protein
MDMVIVTTEEAARLIMAPSLLRTLTSCKENLLIQQIFDPGER